MKQTLKVLDNRKNVYALEQKLKFVNPVLLYIEATVNKKPFAPASASWTWCCHRD